VKGGEGGFVARLHFTEKPMIRLDFFWFRGLAMILFSSAFNDFTTS
jgi:hypothetical protein